MAFPRRLLVLAFIVMVRFEMPPAQAIDVVIDYSYDSSNFFGTGNPDGATAGAEARAALDSAAGFYSDLLTDTFSPIVTPAPFSSAVYDTTVTWSWTHSFPNPTTGANVSLTNGSIAMDEFRIYAGARSLPGNTLGSGGPGGYSASTNVTGSGQVLNSENNQITQIGEDFYDAVETRGETSGFARWGGSITFDNATNWHFDHTSLPASNSFSDFLTVAIHELGHALGLGTSDSWNNWTSGAYYTGPIAVSEYGGPIPLDCADGCSHWAVGTQSTVLGSAATQEASLSPRITPGTRKLFTALDAAAMDDIGWDISLPPITYAAADFDTDGDVDSSDLAIFENWYGPYSNGDTDGDNDTDGTDMLIWQRQYTGTLSPSVANVPEPASLALFSLGFLGLHSLSRRR